MGANIGGESDRVNPRIQQLKRNTVRTQCGVPKPEGRLIGRHGVYQIIEVLRRGKPELRYVRESL
jgi:hypothetical protein